VLQTSRTRPRPSAPSSSSNTYDYPCAGGAISGYATTIYLHILMCNPLPMPTIRDDKLIEQARRAGKHRTKEEAVTAALHEYIKHRKQLRILDAFGSFDFDPAYDYKAERRR
jgi:hypothetical protein